MAQSSWPFHDGSTGTPVLEDQWSIMARNFTVSGVLDHGNDLEVYGDSSGRQVKVKTGRAAVRGHFYESTAEETLAIAANTSGNPRIDRVVLRLAPSANSIVLAVVQGTPAGSPSAPALTQTDTGVFEIALARVAVANGASTITAGNVTDERTFTGPGVPSLGGTATGDVSLDTTGDNRALRFLLNGVHRWSVLFSPAVGTLFVQRRAADGSYAGNDLAILSTGKVESSSHISGLLTGTTNASGRIAITLPTAPSGTAWSLVGNGIKNMTPAEPYIVMPESGATGFYCYSHDGTARASQPVAIAWHAIAY